MSRLIVALVVLSGLAAGCVVPSGPGSVGPRTRCLAQPGRTESYSPDRPLLFLFCAESP
jgi:hypothetical protein